MSKTMTMPQKRPHPSTMYSTPQGFLQEDSDLKRRKYEQYGALA